VPRKKTEDTRNFPPPENIAERGNGWRKAHQMWSKRKSVAGWGDSKPEPKTNLKGSSNAQKKKGRVAEGSKGGKKPRFKMKPLGTRQIASTSPNEKNVDDGGRKRLPRHVGALQRGSGVEVEKNGL